MSNIAIHFFEKSYFSILINFLNVNKFGRFLPHIQKVAYYSIQNLLFCLSLKKFLVETQQPMIRAVAGLLLLGCVGSTLSALFFTMSACYASSDNNEKDMFVTVKRNLIATVLQFLNGKKSFVALFKTRIQGRSQLSEILGAKLKTGGGQSFDGKLLQYFKS